MAITASPLPSPMSVTSLPGAVYLRAADPDAARDYTVTAIDDRSDLEFAPTVLAKRGGTETTQAAEWLDVGVGLLTRRMRVQLGGLAAGTYHLWLVVPGGSDEYLGHATLL